METVYAGRGALMTFTRQGIEPETDVQVVRWLDEITLADRPTVGGKAAVLGALLAAGLPVPMGFCIPVPGEPALPEPEDEIFWGQVEQAYTRLAPDGAPVAVRSSGVEEDSAQASFAGQYESVLDVRGPAALREAVYQCWESAQGERLRAYRGAQGGGLAVLVQLQARASVSGVLFTQDPVTGDNSQFLVEAVRGVGEALLAGRADPVRVWVSRQGQIYSPEEQDLLNPDHCRQLADLALRVEAVLGPGQDIEWAIAGESPVVLQARPIPAVGAALPWAQVWTRANVGEVLPGVITPLTWSVFRAGLVAGRDEAAQAVRRIHGRVYLRLDALLDNFCYLPGVTPAVAAQVLGAALPPGEQAGRPGAYHRPSGLPVRLAQALFWLDASGLLPRLAWMAQRLQLPPQTGSESVQDTIAWTAACFRLHLKVTAYAAAAFGLLSAWVARRLPGEGEAWLPFVLLGQANLQTAAQGLELHRLAQSLQGQPELLALVRSELAWEEIASRAIQVPGGKPFLDAFRAFMAANGARAAGEFELASPRWREDPSFVLQVLRQYLVSPQRAITRELDGQSAQALACLREGLGPFEGWLFVRLLSAYSRYITLRENLKYRLMEGYALLRQSFLQRGAALEAAHVLDAADDVFFLTWEEVLALEGGEAEAGQVKAQVAERKAQHSRWEAQPAPATALGEGREVAPAGEWAGGALTGIACSPGRVEGRARVLTSVAEAGNLLAGEILVAPHTDPGWTPLFLSCKAVVTETGGFLSHGATVAREYGLPCVVNVKDATRYIHTGDLILVDGSAGRVFLGG